MHIKIAARVIKTQKLKNPFQMRQYVGLDPDWEILKSKPMDLSGSTKDD